MAIFEDITRTIVELERDIDRLSAVEIPASTAASGAPVDAQYITLAADATLTDERVLTAGSGLTLTDGGAGACAVLDVSISNGLAFSSGSLVVVTGSGLTLSASGVSLTSPGTLSTSTVNTASGNHVHTVTTTADGESNTDTILQSDANGDLTLRNLTLTTYAFIGPPAASGSTLDGDVTIGLTINQEANDDGVLAFKSSDVAHGMTDFIETDTYGIAKKVEAATGGLRFDGYISGSATAARAIQLIGRSGTSADTDKTTSGHGIIDIKAQIKSGTSVTSVGSDGNLMAISNSNNARWILDAEGTMHQIPGSDTDIDLITVQVTGSPTFGWDESQDQFDFNKGANFAGSVGMGTVLPETKLSVVLTSSNVYSPTALPVDIGQAITNNSQTNDVMSGIVMTARNTSNKLQQGWYGLLSVSGAGRFAPMMVFGSRTGSSSYQEHMRIDGLTGNIGMNTVTLPSTALDIGAGAIEQEEMTAPAAGAANTTRTYAEDNAGTTRQQVKFSSGNAVTIAEDGGLQTYTITNFNTDRAYDRSATTLGEIADVLGTLIADFQAAGVLG